MIRFIVVRHGQSEDNVTSTTSDSKREPNLTESGRAQSRKFGQILKDHSISRVYCSSAKRSQQTATEIADELSLEIFVDDNLKEIDVGSLTGLPWKEVEPILNACWQTWSMGERSKKLGTVGESFDDAETRVRAFLDTLTDYPNDTTSVVVVHGGFSNILYALCDNTDFIVGHEKSLGNTVPALFDYEPDTGKIHCLQWGGLDHSV